MATKSEKPGRQLIAQNKRARHDYFIEETFEAGIVLLGSEVKALRAGRGTINESYVGPMEGELYLFNGNIQAYKHANPKFQHEPRRPRKLLLKKPEVKRLLGAVQRKGQALVPVSLYFNSRGLVKLQVGLGTGKKQHDKRETVKQRDWGRQKNRLLRKGD